MASNPLSSSQGPDGEATFLYATQLQAPSFVGIGSAHTFRTTDTSFVDNPPTSSKASSKFSTPAPTASESNRGGVARRGSVGRGVRGTKASGLARASARARRGG